MYTQEFSAPWPAALGDMLEFIVLTHLSFARGRTSHVRVALSRQRVAPEALQPHVEHFRVQLARQVPQARLELKAEHHPVHRVEIRFGS